MGSNAQTRSIHHYRCFTIPHADGRKGDGFRNNTFINHSPFSETPQTCQIHEDRQTSQINEDYKEKPYNPNIIPAKTNLDTVIGGKKRRTKKHFRKRSIGKRSIGKRSSKKTKKKKN